MTASLKAPARQVDTCRAGRPAVDSVRAASRANWRRRQKRIAMGLPSTDLVDAQPTREHIQSLQAGGMSIKGIAAAADVSYMTINRILYTIGGHPPALRIRPESAAAILAVQPRPQLLAILPGHGTRRRLQALIALGWTFGQVADAMDWNDRNLRHLLYHDGGVYADTYRRACRVYDQMWNQLPPRNTRQQRCAVTKARNVATRNGWVSPLAWDDHLIDDPTACPDLGHGRFDAADHRAALVARLTAAGRSVSDIAAQVGMHRRSVRRLQERAS